GRPVHRRRVARGESQGHRVLSDDQDRPVTDGDGGGVRVDQKSEQCGTEGSEYPGVAGCRDQDHHALWKNLVAARHGCARHFPCGITPTTIAKWPSRIRWWRSKPAWFKCKGRLTGSASGAAMPISVRSFPILN